MKQPRVGFIGAGNLASALVRGMLDAGCFAATDVRVSDVDASRTAGWARDHGIAAAASNAELAGWATVLFLAVKPGAAAGVLTECSASLRPGSLALSVMAGIRCATLAAGLPESTRIVRAMPNTPALVAAGATALCAGPRATAADLQLSQHWFDAVGTTVVVSEPQMDAVTGLSGSGPAYVMLVVEALADGGVRSGLPRDVALALATQTVLGSAKLLAAGGEHPAVVRDRVTSPGGTTAAGLKALEAGGVRHAMAEAVERATQRARELGDAE
jgi:pyrroline-5-carboxylate reductase